MGTEADGRVDVGDEFPEESMWNDDESALLVRGFTPTRFELQILARLYLDLAEDEDFFQEWSRQAGGSWRRVAFASRRLDRIVGPLGEQAVTEAVAEVEGFWRKKFEDLKLAQDEHRKVCPPGSPCYGSDDSRDPFCDVWERHRNASRPHDSSPKECDCRKKCMVCGSSTLKRIGP